MTDQPDADEQPEYGPPHVTIEFVGGPFCGEVVDSRKQSLRGDVVRRLLSAARSERPAELRLRWVCPRWARVAVGRGRHPRPTAGRGGLHRYRLLVDLGFASRVLFRAVYSGEGRV